MYRGGLIFNIVAQVMSALAWLALAILVGSYAELILGATSAYTLTTSANVDVVNSTVGSITNPSVSVLSPLATGLIVASVIFLIFNVIGIILCSSALKNLAAAESGKESFRSGFGTAAGVIGLFTNFIGGILVLVGITSEKERLNGRSGSRSHNSFDNRRDDYRQRRSDDFDRGRRDDRRDSYRRDDRRDSYRRDDERDDYGRGR